MTDDFLTVLTQHGILEAIVLSIFVFFLLVSRRT